MKLGMASPYISRATRLLGGDLRVPERRKGAMAEPGLRNVCLVQCDSVFSSPTDFRTHLTKIKRVNRAMLPSYEFQH
jgi:hypothetical protein